MPIYLGANPWILILLISLELLLIMVPALISAKIEKKPFKTVIREMGFSLTEMKLKKTLLEVVAGIGLGLLLYFTSGFILTFTIQFVELIFGTEFVNQGINNAINTTPIEPDLIQLIIIIILQVIIVAPCEEGFFRGFILKKCNSRIKLIYSLLISSAIFALFHVPPFIVPITTLVTFYGYYFLLGCSLALLFTVFRSSLIPGIATHALFNVLVILL